MVFQLYEKLKQAESTLQSETNQAIRLQQQEAIAGIRREISYQTNQRETVLKLRDEVNKQLTQNKQLVEEADRLTTRTKQTVQKKEYAEELRKKWIPHLERELAMFDRDLLRIDEILGDSEERSKELADKLYMKGECQ